MFKPRLSDEQGRALALLVNAGRTGATQPRLTALGFDSGTITGLVDKGLATVTLSKVGTGSEIAEVGRIRIKAAGRMALEG